jgi:multidrug efflux pump subunit AcrA (membrane-fusion protein)
MTKLIRFIIPAIASIALISCGGENQQQGSGVPEYPVIEVSTGNYTGFQDYPTKIEGIQNIQIRAKVSGYVDEILVDEGETLLYLRMQRPRDRQLKRLSHKLKPLNWKLKNSSLL